MTKFLLVTCAVVSFCFVADTHKKKNISIEPYMQVQNDAFFKVLVLTSPDSYADYIDGFNFEWGYHYKLKVNEVKLSLPPEDGSSIKYKLIRILSKEKVAADYQFRLGLYRDLYLGPGDDQVNNFKEINDSTFLYFETVELEIPAEFKEGFNKIKNDGIDGSGQFVFLGEKKIRMVKLN